MNYTITTQMDFAPVTGARLRTQLQWPLGDNRMVIETRYGTYIAAVYVDVSETKVVSIMRKKS